MIFLDKNVFLHCGKSVFFIMFGRGSYEIRQLIKSVMVRDEFIIQKFEHVDNRACCPIGHMIAKSK